MAGGGLPDRFGAEWCCQWSTSAPQTLLALMSRVLGVRAGLALAADSFGSCGLC